MKIWECTYIRSGMKITQTIGNGASRCDFRFIKGYQTPIGWPPDDLEEFKLNKKIVIEEGVVK